MGCVAPSKRPNIKTPKIISSIFFLPYISDNFPAIENHDIPVTRGSASIHDESSYEMSRSTMKSGIAGKTIVSADMAIIPKPLRIASVIHGEEVMCFSGFWIFILLARDCLCFDCGREVCLHAHLFEQDVHVCVAVELLDLAVFHDPEVSAGNVEFGSVRLKDAGRRLVWPGEGAPDRQLDRNDVVLNDHPMEFTVNVGSELGQEHHGRAQLVTAEGHGAEH